MISELIRQYVISEIKPNLHDWFIEFESHRRKQEEKPEDEGNSEWVSYREKISHSTDAARSIRWRMEFLLRNLLERFPDLSRKDNQRDFTHIQKLAIFRRDKGVFRSNVSATARNSFGMIGTQITVSLGRKVVKQPSIMVRSRVQFATYPREGARRAVHRGSGRDLHRRA